MLSEGLKSFTAIPLMLVGMMIFVSTYLAILGVTLWSRRAAKSFEQAAQLPLLEEE